VTDRTSVSLVTVEIPASLATAASGRRIAVRLEAEPGAVTVSDVLDALAAQLPALERRLRDETGQVRRFVNLYVDGVDVRAAQGPATPVPDGGVVTVIPSVAGG
jgi:molybdopterin synthase sulfur carrier subunit